MSERSTTQKAPVVELPASMSVKDLADLMHISAIEVIKQLMRNGIMANVNQVINYDVAAVVATGYGYESKPKARSKTTASAAGRIKKQVKEELGSDLQYPLWSPSWATLITARLDYWMPFARLM
jgi:translation initiation factor IF-2